MDTKRKDTFIRELIAFLKKWNLWESVSISGEGKCYAQYAYVDEEDGGESEYVDGVYISAEEEMHYPDWYVPGNHPPRFIVWHEGAPLSELLTEKQYDIDVQAISYDAFLKIVEAEGLRQEYIESGELPILNCQDFDSFEEYEALEQELEEEMLYKKYLCATRFDFEDCENTADMIVKELHDLVECHNMKLYNNDTCSSFIYDKK